MPRAREEDATSAAVPHSARMEPHMSARPGVNVGSRRMPCSVGVSSCARDTLFRRAASQAEGVLTGSCARRAPSATEKMLPSALAHLIRQHPHVITQTLPANTVHW